MAKTPNVSLRVDQDLWAKFRVATQERGDTMTKVIEERIADYLGQPSTRVRTAAGLNKREAEIYGVTKPTVRLIQPQGRRVHLAYTGEDGKPYQLVCLSMTPDPEAKIVADDEAVTCTRCARSV